MSENPDAPDAPEVPEVPDAASAARLQRDARVAGICAACLHARRVENDRGSVFFRCDYARLDPAFPKYPALPVLRCTAFTQSA